jgi:hypothetical protein
MFLSGLRAEAQRRWQEPSSRPLLLDGPGAELLHKGEEIGHAPVLGDLAVAHAHDINGLELNLTARRCHAQEFSPVRPVVGLVRDSANSNFDLMEARRRHPRLPLKSSEDFGTSRWGSSGLEIYSVGRRCKRSCMSSSGKRPIDA